MKQKFYICKHCVNLGAMIRGEGVPIMNLIYEYSSGEMYIFGSPILI